MSGMQYRVDFQPTQDQIGQLKAWMIEENRQRAKITHDLSIVTGHARDNTLATICFQSEAVGFVTWDIFKRRGYIVVAAIAASHRRSGVGRCLMENLFAHLVRHGVLVLYLQCSPSVSEKFWRKMGFIKMPDIFGYGNGDSPKLYKSLVPGEEQGPDKIPYILIHHRNSNKKIRRQILHRPGTNELINPIILPVSGDWCIEYWGADLLEGPVKIKNFRSGQCYDEPFLIIKSL